MKHDRPYFIEIVEDGVRLPRGPRQGYDTLFEATEAAKRLVDDALPRNTVRILREVDVAYLSGDGGTYLRSEGA